MFIAADGETKRGQNKEVIAFSKNIPQGGVSKLYQIAHPGGT